jgi:hypothetical protein
MKLPTIIILLLVTSGVAESYEFTAERILEVESQLYLPPDLGLNGDAPLLGYDSDGNGVRDDIQRYLKLRYFDEVELKAVFYDYASELLNRIHVVNESRETIQNLYRESGKSHWCLIWLNNNSERDYKLEIRELSKRIFNTLARHKADRVFESKLAGMRISAKDPDKYYIFCENYGLSG